MGEFDCYCALCSGPLYHVQIGSSSRARLNRRRRRVSRKLAAIEAGRSFDSFDSDSDSEDESDKAENDGEEDEDEDDVYEEEERRSYDPEIVTEERVAWVEDIRVLGVNRDGNGERAFISGPANYDDAGLIYVQKGDDPNQPSVDEKPFFDCYVSSNDNEVVFPFHTHCMTVLEEAFQWGFNRSQTTKQSLNLNTLYKTAVRIGGPGNFQFDYGGIRGVDQCWESIPGEEFSVIDPLYFLQTTLGLDIKPTTTTTNTKKTQSLPHRKRAIIDPFQSIPIEILHLICQNLPAEALQAFLTASVTAYYTTLDEGFWKGLCLGRVPWAWEVWNDIKNTLSEDGQVENEEEGEGEGEECVDYDYKKLYLRLDLNTAKRIGLGARDGCWMGLVNRRRIWDACLMVLGEYEKDR